MRLRKLVLPVLATCLTLSLASPSAANTIVDTGTPILNSPWVFEPSQYFAGEFTIVDSFIVQTIEGYWSVNSGAGTVDIAVHADNGNLPGAVLFSASTPLVAPAPLGWYGVFALNQVLNPGTYWVSFKPSGIVSGTIKGLAPNPLVDYVQGFGDYSWIDNGFNYGISARITGDLVAAVPDVTSTLSLCLGVALLGFAAQRLWT